jgi:hypothetical protein
MAGEPVKLKGCVFAGMGQRKPPRYQAWFFIALISGRTSIALPAGAAH